MEIDYENATNDIRTFVPGLYKPKKGEEMVHDPTAYHMLHSIRPEWPCLSFDFLSDKLGTNRTRYPHTVFAVSGTQAAKGNSNKIQVIKFSDLYKTQRKADQSDDDSESMDSDASMNGRDINPILEHVDIPHDGCINRIRSMPQNPGIVATWSELGYFSIRNVSKQIEALEKGGYRNNKADVVYKFKRHLEEGFAMDFSKVCPGNFVTGCCGNLIFIHTPTEASTWIANENPSAGHSGSVEDLKWSPTEKTVFGSVSADGSIAIWDTRRPTSPMISVSNAHSNTDVNVMAWNSNITYLLGSGGDDGSFKVWDLRTFASSKSKIGKNGDQPSSVCQPDPIANFKWHSEPITSIDWDPNDESMIAVSGADNQVSLWDLSVEADDGDLLSGPNSGKDGLGLPPQLLFVHQGQNDVKEIHYHPQITGLIMSTAADGFNLWKPATVLEGEEK
mmetsp:Transcript_2842/g.3974  ORF Transcript_2842/g.3974 Transcript_2842/m.3974 type:complete len:447 (-) Transcript_2842:13-1353(-)